MNKIVWACSDVQIFLLNLLSTQIIKINAQR
jgi:hypothetical protein